MIQTLFITIVPMFFAAAILMVGGIQLSKKSVTDITPHDKERLLSFSYLFQKELSRLEKLYLSHLNDLSQLHHKVNQPVLRTQSQNFYGIHDIYIINAEEISANKKRGDEIKYPQISIGNRLDPPAPALSVAYQKSAVRSSTSVIYLPASLMKDDLSKGQQWLSTPSQFYKVYTTKPSEDALVAFMIDYRILHQVTIKSLAEWIEKKSTLLTESNERVIVRSQLTPKPLFSSGSDHHGPAAMVIPYRSHLGDFEITAWDAVEEKIVYNSVIVTITTVLSASLCLTGFLLFFSHQRTNRLARQRVSFVNQVSHELGTPLTNLNLNLALTKEFFDRNPSESKKRLEIVGEELTRLSRLVTNVLTFSQKERDNLRLNAKPCLPAEIISSAVDSYRPALERFDFEIQTDLSETPPLLLDPDALSQIVTNLISNVEKYASAGKKISIILEYSNEKLIITVSDNGPGILESQASRIFEPFRRLSQDTNEGVSGMGLGLTIARELTHKMNGTLDILPSRNGAVFQLILPAKLAK